MLAFTALSSAKSVNELPDNCRIDYVSRIQQERLDQHRSAIFR